jgi:putative ATPase
MILWGPPGVGKTTLARLMADAFGLEFIAISAVLGGVKDIRDAVERAKAQRQRTGQATVVFVDEVHRFNKAQQDAFLPHVEAGLFVFIGATTENPSFEVVGALLSRAAVYVLKPLSADDMQRLIDRALAQELGRLDVTVEARELLIDLADGDGRRLLNALEIVAGMASVDGRHGIDADFLRARLPATLRRFDKGGENFYDQISALHKSVRGSDPDAALYWLVRMLDGGTDPLYLARRIVRMAVEDIGEADPLSLLVANAARETYDFLGSPEGELALAQAVVHLATAPKSVAVYEAFKAAQRSARETGSLMPPAHIRSPATKLLKDLGYGAGYQYDPDTPEGFSGANYFPDGMTRPTFYAPKGEGHEEKVKARLERWAALRAAKGEGGT